MGWFSRIERHCSPLAASSGYSSFFHSFCNGIQKTFHHQQAEGEYFALVLPYYPFTRHPIINIKEGLLSMNSL
jgi:hypothetical protein